MARSIPPDRFDQLLRAAQDVFIAQGYGRTQMEDVAKALGVGKGTLYGYVESKQALFDFVVEHVGATGPIPVPARLPVPTPRPGTTVRRVHEALEAEGRLPVLEAALRDDAPGDVAAELDAVGRELYERLHRNRLGIKLLERCSRDYPELHALWHSEGRHSVVSLLQAYLTARIAAGHFRPVPDVHVGARFFLELVTTWAVHVHWDPAPEAIDEAVALDTVLHFLRGAFLATPR